MSKTPVLNQTSATYLALQENTYLMQENRSRFQYLFTVFELCAGLGTDGFCLLARDRERRPSFRTFVPLVR